MPEVSAADLATLQASKALLDTIYSDPDHGLSVKRAVAKARPDLTIPELKAEEMFKPFAERFDAMAGSVTALAKSIEDDKAASAQKAAEDTLARAMASARDNYKLTDEGVTGMVELMRNEGIANPKTAAELFVARQPKPKLASGRENRYGQTVYADITGHAGDKEKQELLLTNSDRFLVQEVEEMLAEFENAA